MSRCSNPLSDILKEDVYFIVGVPNEKVNGGVATQPGDMSFIIEDYIGWKTRLIRGGSPQWLTNPGDGDQYFDYTSITGEFTVSVELAPGEKIICQAVKPVTL